jgi:hypothetical protein
MGCVEDLVRCVCNFNDDDGTMVQCDRCGMWQHEHCVTNSDAAGPSYHMDAYVCYVCVQPPGRRPAAELREQLLRDGVPVMPDVQFTVEEGACAAGDNNMTTTDRARERDEYNERMVVHRKRLAATRRRAELILASREALIPLVVLFECVCLCV